MMLQQQMVPQQQMNIPKRTMVNAQFRDSRGKKINLVVDTDITIEELYKKYVDRAPLYGHDIKDLQFIVNNKTLGKNDKTKIKDYFRSEMNYLNFQNLPIITAYFFHDDLLINK